MAYPSLEAVEKANRITLAEWYRFLPSPGINCVDRSNFKEVIDREAPIMDRICERFREMDGMTSEISKKIGL